MVTWLYGARSNTKVLMNYAQFDPLSSQIPEFSRGKELHNDSVAYESMDADGHFHPTIKPIFNDQDLLIYLIRYQCL